MSRIRLFLNNIENQHTLSVHDYFLSDTSADQGRINHKTVEEVLAFVFCDFFIASLCRDKRAKINQVFRKS